MFVMRTRGDAVMLGIVSLLLIAFAIMGLTHPLPRVPADAAAYEPRSGTLASARDPGGRLSARVRFHLQGDARHYETRALDFRHGAIHWQPGRTRLAFAVQRGAPHAGTDNDPVAAMGLAVDGVPLRSLPQDIQAQHALADRPAAEVMLTVGLLCLVVAVFTWRRLGAR
jgi:hypothetical protein